MLANICLFWLFIIGFNDFKNHKRIIKNNKPVKVIGITYRAKSKTKCKVEYKNKVYNNISYPFGNIRIGTYDRKKFYYDEKNDKIFIKDEGFFAICVLIALCILSLMM